MFLSVVLDHVCRFSEFRLKGTNDDPPLLSLLSFPSLTYAMMTMTMTMREGRRHKCKDSRRREDERRISQKRGFKEERGKRGATEGRGMGGRYVVASLELPCRFLTCCENKHFPQRGKRVQQTLHNEKKCRVDAFGIIYLSLPNHIMS